MVGFATISQIKSRMDEEIRGVRAIIACPATAPASSSVHSIMCALRADPQYFSLYPLYSKCRKFPPLELGFRLSAVGTGDGLCGTLARIALARGRDGDGAG